MKSCMLCDLFYHLQPKLDLEYIIDAEQRGEQRMVLPHHGENGKSGLIDKLTDCVLYKENS